MPDNGVWLKSLAAMNIQDFTTEQLKDELARRGFQTHNLWQVADVDSTIERINEGREEDGEEPIIISEEDKYIILVQVMESDGVMSAINDCLWDYIQDEYLPNLEN